jgi:glutamate dehydrogenase/leucine dehydrogenase
MLLPFIGPVKDISEPSRGTDGRVMSWMMDTYSMLVGHTVPGVVTGKPLSLGGTRGSADATGRGVMFVVRRALADSGVAIDGAKAAVVGFGSVGRAAALHLARKGCRVVAAADLGGGVHRPDGLDVGALSSWAGERGSVAGFPGAGAVSDEELMALGVDALVVASREMAVTAQNQRLVAAPLVAEAVDASVSSEACDALHERGAVVLPDLLAGAGGDTLSYFEWVQNASSILWSEREVNVRLRDLMLKAYDEVSAVARERGVDMRTAAYVLGVGRLVDAQSWRGVWP